MKHWTGQLHDTNTETLRCCYVTSAHIRTHLDVTKVSRTIVDFARTSVRILAGSTRGSQVGRSQRRVIQAAANGDAGVVGAGLCDFDH